MKLSKMFLSVVVLLMVVSATWAGEWATVFNDTTAYWKFNYAGSLPNDVTLTVTPIPDDAAGGNGVDYATADDPCSAHIPPQTMAPEWRECPGVGDGVAVWFAGGFHEGDTCTSGGASKRYCKLGYDANGVGTLRNLSGDITLFARINVDDFNGGSPIPALACVPGGDRKIIRCANWGNKKGFWLNVVGGGGISLSWCYGLTTTTFPPSTSYLNKAVGTAGLAMNPGTWYDVFVVLKANTTARTAVVKFYVKESAADAWWTQSYSFTNTLGVTPVGGTGGSGDASIGADGFQNFFSGAMESLAAWPRALKDSEIPGMPDLTAEWPMSPLDANGLPKNVVIPSTSPVDDTTGNSNSVDAATTTPAPQWVACAGIGDGYAIDFDGVDCRLTYDTPKAGTVRTINGKMSAFVRFNADDVSKGQFVTMKTATAGFNFGIKSGKLAIDWANSSGSYTVSDTTTLQTGTWYDAYAVIDQNTTLNEAYVTFYLQKTTSVVPVRHAFILSGTQGPGLVGTNTATSTIGGLGTDNAYAFNGQIESIKVYKSPLKPVEIPGFIAINPYLMGDLNNDGTVDFKDVSIFGTNWLATSCPGFDTCGGSDLNVDTKVSYTDYTKLAANWRVNDDRLAKLNNGITIVTEGDLHACPASVMQATYDDADSIKTDFSVICGDIVGSGTGMRESKASNRPIYMQQGDHENFEEWGYLKMDSGVVPASRLRSGTYLGNSPRTNQLGMMSAEMPYAEAWTGLPYFWSMNYKGVHFIFMQGAKDQPVSSFMLKWLTKDLQDNSSKTTVIFTHRIVFEKGERWNLTGQWNNLIASQSQVKLIMYGHYHYAIAPSADPNQGIPGFWIGSALTMATELIPGIPAGRTAGTLNRDVRCFPVISVASDGIRIWSRRYDLPLSDAGGLVPVMNNLVATTYNASAQTSVSLPYLMTENGKHYVPALAMKNTTMKLWGVENEQLMPDPVFASSTMPWTAASSATLSAVVQTNPIGIPKMLKMDNITAYGTDEYPEVIASSPIMNLIESGKTQCWTSTTGPDAYWILASEYGYETLGFVKAATAGRRIWLKLDFMYDDETPEVTYYRKMTVADPNKMYYCYQNTYCGTVRGQYWMWSLGPAGFEEVTEWVPTGVSGNGYDKPFYPRQATKLQVSFVTPDTIETPETWYGSVFTYTAPNGYFTVPTIGRNLSWNSYNYSGGSTTGRDWTKGIVVNFNGTNYGSSSSLQESSTPLSYSLGTVLGGTPFSVTTCNGSKLVLVELKGDVDSLMVNELRTVTEGPAGVYTIGASVEDANSNNPAYGTSKVDIFKKSTVDTSISVEPKTNGSHRTVTTGTVVDTTH